MHQIHKKLITYAYNITGSLEDAKDLAQDTIEKYLTVDKSTVKNEHNYLVKTVINRAINFKNRKQLSETRSNWLPEPVITNGADDKLIAADTAKYSLLVLMEKLNARERAVFILKEGYNYAHEEIAELLNITPDNCRQLLSRAKQNIQQNKTVGTKTPTKPIELYINAIINGDTRQLEKILVDDISVVADGGKTHNVVSAFTFGKEAAINLMQLVYNVYQKTSSYVITEANHLPAILFFDNGKLINCQVFEYGEDNRICNIYSVVDAEKLINISKQNLSQNP